MIVQAIIPARGGSKGIPRKNLIEICGKPLIAYSIEHALQTPEISEVIVSTDSDEIGAFSESLGATVIERPPELSGDTASSESALLHSLDVVRERQGCDPDLVVFLQATSPLRPPGAISDAIHTLQYEGADSLFSASPVHGFVWRMEADGPAPLNYEYGSRPRRQDCEEYVEENGSIYIFRPSILRTHGSRLGGKIAVSLMDPLFAVQVDEPKDLDRVERLIEHLGKEAAPSSERLSQ